MKTYQIDVHSELLAACNGVTVKFPEWKCVGQLRATRCAKALRRAEKMFPGRAIRARLITGQFSGGAR